ncbi:hypothetical protein [Corynebacterium callunae]|uniref:hypothetical protein n=1 Tax=Corynebacterium callunae TaxID=1721 RepID=UPI001FFFFF3B|nr:hypothetical protein [Corynebacterium callunae]MCK2200209.1 hypothetical protein [Corynebacterium callunae]
MRTPGDVFNLHQKIKDELVAQEERARAALRQSLVETKAAFDFFTDLGHDSTTAIALADIALANVLEE